MDDKEIETLAELISIKTSEKYLNITKEFTETQIALHSAQCEARKYKGLKNLLSGMLGAVIVLLADWIKKLF